MRYYSVRAPHAGMRIRVVALPEAGRRARLRAPRPPPGGDAADYDFSATHEMATQLALTIPQPNMSCVAAGADGSLAALAAAGGIVVGGAAPLCDEWVIGVLGDTWTDVDPNHAVPQVAESAYELVVRTEPDHPDFACAECGFDCTRCGWVAGHGTQFVVDSLGQRVARLTNTTAQMGTLWLDHPRKIDRGFEARFTFRVSDFTYCNEPFERFGHVNRAVKTTEELILGKGANYEGGSEHFMPAEGLRNNGESPTHYRMDDPDLPWEPLYPPTGIPLDLAQSLGRMSNPPARSGEQLPLPFSGGPGGGAAGRVLPVRAAGPWWAAGLRVRHRVGGPDAAGCAGAGVGYASVPDGPLACSRSISRSVAIQFDTHARLRIDACRQDADPDDTRAAQVGPVERDGNLHRRPQPAGGRAHGVHDRPVVRELPDRRRRGAPRRDAYTAAARSTARPTSRRRRHPRHRPQRPRGDARPRHRPLRGRCCRTVRTRRTGSRRSRSTSTSPSTASTSSAWVGFTASTSDIAAEHHDIRSFSFCERLGCAALKARTVCVDLGDIRFVLRSRTD